MAKTDVTPFNRDKLNMISRGRAAEVTHSALFPINDLPAHEQITAVAVLFAVLTSRFGLDPHETFKLGHKLLRPEPFHRTANVQMEALEDFANLQRTGQF